MPVATATPWELWVLRGFDPTATADDVQRLIEVRGRHNAWERALFRRLLDGDVKPLQPGRELLAGRPDLAAGLVVTMHLGPFQFVLEPFVAAGLDLHVLLNADTARRLRPVAERLGRALHHQGRIHWHAVEDPACARDLLRAIRSSEPVLAFADGNQGTRDAGVSYQLPGREIRVRTGLARLICRLECPVHPVCVRWSPDGRSVVWRPQPTQRWSRGDDPAAVTHRLYDWVFAEVGAAPAEWSYWPMLGEAAGCFARGYCEREVPAGLHADFRRAFLVALARASGTIQVELEVELAVWPGDTLADLTNDRFFVADSLQECDLDLLRGDPPTLAALVAARGRTWVANHVLRLCLLGIARLRGDGP